MGRFLLPACVTVVVLSLGCGEDPAQPAPHLEVTLGAATHILGINTSAPPYLRCDGTLTAGAVGDPDVVATWGSATAELSWGPESAGVLHTVTFPGSDINQWFGGPLSAGAETTLLFWFESEFPFRGRWRQRYRVGEDGEEKIADAEFRCAPPAVPDADPPSATLEAQGVPEAIWGVEVAYSLTAGAGLWTAVVRVADPPVAEIALDIEPWVTTAAGTLIVGVPWNLPLGEPVALSLVLTDAVGAVFETSIETAPLRDSRSPDGHVHRFCGDLSTDDCPLVVGRTLDMTISSQDASVHWMTLTVGDPVVATDSIRIPAGVHLGEEIPVVVPADWQGSHPVTVAFVDTLGHASEPVGVWKVTVSP